MIFSTAIFIEYTFHLDTDERRDIAIDPLVILGTLPRVYGDAHHYCNDRSIPAIHPIASSISTNSFLTDAHPWRRVRGEEGGSTNSVN